MEADLRDEFNSRADLNNPQVGTDMHRLWAARGPDPWHEDPYYYTRLGQLANRVGQPMFALDVLAEALSHFPKDVRLNQLHALAQIRCGFLTRAGERLAALVRKGHEDEETLGILGRVYKEIWQRSGGGPEHPHLKRSRNLYLKAFLESHGYYSGINAASLSLVMGDRKNAEKLARAVIRLCEEAAKRGPDYWVMATLGEANLVLEKPDVAAKWYEQATSMVRRNFTDIASTRRQLNLLARYTHVDSGVMDCLRLPTVVAFTGHLIDAPGRKQPRFPRQAAEEVKKRIKTALDDLNAGIGYSSAACGSDTLFLECMQARGAECNVVLPFDKHDFFRVSVDFAGKTWRARTERALENASQIRQTAEGLYAGDDILFDYANRTIMGRTILRSRLLETDARLLAVWNRDRKPAPGGTAEFLRIWDAFGGPRYVVDISDLRSAPASVSGNHVEIEPPLDSGRGSQSLHAGAGLRRGTRALLFADLVGFSKLREQQFPIFVTGFLKTLARCRKRGRHKPVFKNIWGDALYFVFENVSQAADYALDLRDAVRRTDWTACGLPTDLTMRIGLHVGPVYYGREPLLGRVNYFGHHVNHAARIEPITTPGNVYASEQFAALIMSEPARHVECSYVGVVVLPKDFGSYPIYLVRRAGEIE